jgi:uncharacterized protein (TIGR04552 family)
VKEFDGRFPEQELSVVIGGTSALDLTGLHLHETPDIEKFVAAYGYNLNNEADRTALIIIYQRALELIKSDLLDEREKIPEQFLRPPQDATLSDLLRLASEKNNIENQKWACAILRVMHVFVHLRNDLFSAFREEIQTQILKPFKEAIQNDELGGGVILGSGRDFGDVGLHRFEIKPFKTTSSSAIKLLAHRNRMAMTLFDKLGVRFVTRNLGDAFRVTRFLLNHHLISFPHIIASESNNTMYPLPLFLEVVKVGVAKNLSPEKMEALFQERLKSLQGAPEFLDKENEFSDPNYRFIKFITRKLVVADINSRRKNEAFRFFYPFEVQIMDHDTWIRNMAGPMAHSVYKDRQRRRARMRVFGLTGANDERKIEPSK